MQEEPRRLERSEKGMNLIILNVGDHVLKKIELCTLAASTWSTLERLYLSKTLPIRIQLQHKFYTFKMIDTRSIDENIDDFLEIVSYLSSVNVTVLKEVQAILLLNSLPSRFNSLKETFKYGKDTLSLEEVTSAARTKDQDLKTSTSFHDNGEGYYARGGTLRGKKPGYLHLRRFGLVIYVHADQGKLKARGKMGIFVSYPTGVKGYKVWLLEEKKSVISMNVIFTEDKVYKDLNVCEVKAYDT